MELEFLKKKERAFLLLGLYRLLIYSLTKARSYLTGFHIVYTICLQNKTMNGLAVCISFFTYYFLVYDSSEATEMCVS